MISGPPDCSKRQSRLKHAGLLLGWELPRKQVGFACQAAPAARAGIYYAGDGHLLVSAPTGCGKFIAAVGPLLAQFLGSAIVFDVKGECAQVWARHRRWIGQTVAIFDPFHLVTTDSARLDVCDVFDLPGACPDADCEMLAAMLSTGHEFSSDRYWTDTARGIVAGSLRYIVSLPKQERKLSTLRQMLHNDNVSFNYATLLDAGKVPPGLAYDEFVAFLTAPDDKTRPCILSTAQTFMKSMLGRECETVLENSTISLRDLYDGVPQTIFVVAPQDRLESHRGFWRLILQILMTAVARRRIMPATATLFLVDEAAAMGDFPALKQALVLGRGSGMQVQTVWQDLSQLKATFPKDWETVLSNSGVLQAFGFQNHWLASTWSQIMGCSAHELASMERDEQALCIQGRGFVHARKLNYLRDPVDLFVGRFDVNPRYAQVGERYFG